MPVFLVLQAHINRYEIDGVRFDTEAPLFMYSLVHGDEGLFISVHVSEQPGVRTYLFMPQDYLVQIMDGWNDLRGRSASVLVDMVVPFAIQNEHRFRQFVMNLEKKHIESDETMTVWGNEFRALKLRKPTKIERLEDYK
ncbi:hypothetical protein D3C71_531560 [compost metagenome]